MTADESRAIAGTILKYLQYDQSDKYKYERALFEESFTQYISFADEADNLVCLRELLERLCGSGIGDAYFIYIVEDNESCLFCKKIPSDIGRDDADTLASLLTRYVKSCALPESGMRVEDIRRKNLEGIFGAENVSEKGTSPGRFTHGYIFLGGATQLWRRKKTHFVLCILGRQEKVDPTFVQSWLQALVLMWSAAFSTALFTHRNYLHECRNGGKVLDLETLFHYAEKAHPWLTSADICADHDLVYNLIAQEKMDRVEAIAKIKEYGNCWHWCQERLTCKGNDELYRPTLHPILDWILWRLKDGELSGALARSLGMLSEYLISIVSPVRLDTVLWKAALPAILAPFDAEDGLPHPNTEAFETARDHLGRFAAMVLSDMPQTPESIESTAWTLAEYAYRGLGVDPRLHLASHIRHGARGEPSLHMMNEFYRDHFFHTIEVCFLGMLLMGAVRTGWCTKAAFKDSKDLRRQWFVAALLHDMGYAVDVCKGLRDWLGFFVSGSFAALNMNVKHALDSMNASDGMEKFYKGFGFTEKDKPWEDHGLLSAHHLAALIEDIKPDKSYGAAIDAIARHNSTKVGIEYKDGEYLSALLALCDLLQAWRRPQFPHFSLAPAWMMSAIGGQQHPLHPKTFSPKLLTNLEFKEKAGYLQAVFDGPLVLRLEFDEPVNRNSCVFNIWLDIARNLQRIDFSKLPHDILVQVVTPCYQPLGAGPRLRQMDRLRDAAEETHMAYLSGFFPKKKVEQASIPDVNRITGSEPWLKKPLTYHYESERSVGGNDNPVREMLTFSLRQMKGKKDLMTEGLSRFRKDLAHWRKYGDDRTFVGDYSPWRHKKDE